MRRHIRAHAPGATFFFTLTLRGLAVFQPASVRARGALAAGLGIGAAVVEGAVGE